MKTAIPKRILIYLFVATIVVSMVTITILVYQKTEDEPNEYIDKHRDGWSSLLSQNSEVLPYLEQFYKYEDEFSIVCRNGELTVDESMSNTLTSDELGKLEVLFDKFKLETIRMRKESDNEQKKLEVISQQMIFGKFFRKYYCTALLVYSPNKKQDKWTELFPNWYYRAFLET